MSHEKNLKTSLVFLYHGRSTVSKVFRWGLLVFDLLCIAYFVVGNFYHHDAQFHALETVIGLIYLVELAARLYISEQRLRDVFNPIGLADIIVIASLLAPSLAENFAFLRALRSLRLLRSYHVLKTLRQHSPYIKKHEDIIFGVINLSVFIFVMTAIVFEMQFGKNPAIQNYVDALYFTIAALTTTGFGDITLTGTSGHLLAVLIMIFGISLFIRLIQVIFRPEKVRYECPTCGLKRHDHDAVHCKHCGTILHIETEGAD